MQQWTLKFLILSRNKDDSVATTKIHVGTVVEYTSNLNYSSLYLIQTKLCSNIAARTYSWLVSK